MRKVSMLVVFLIFFALSAYAENTRKITATHYYEGNPKKERTFYNSENKEIAKEYYHVDGSVMGVKGSIPNGEVREYYSSGQLMSLASYKTNLLLNEIEYFEEGGKKSEIVNVWEGRNLIKSKHISYYENGAKHQEVTMDGKGDGVSKVYYGSGELFEDAKLKNTFREGPVTRYYKNGKPMLTGFMKDDMLEGAATEYDSKGKAVKKVVFQKDKEVQ